ncbi:MAG: shikimate kinase [Calditerrivibrio sp.]|nr:shikimate kinase [Calditerrivibrio sp.]
MGNVYFIGFMGTGKTTISKLLAEMLNRKWVDLDEEIVKREKRTISEIFQADGEGYFRAVEGEVLRDIAEKDNYVVSTGGGIVIFDENIALMKKSGVMVTLVASPEVIYERLKDDQCRPLLQVPDPMSEIKRLMYERAPYYIKGDLIVDTSYGSPETIVKQIIMDLEKLWKK